jgi:hypothetical protein
MAARSEQQREISRDVVVEKEPHCGAQFICSATRPSISGR